MEISMNLISQLSIDDDGDGANILSSKLSTRTNTNGASDMMDLSHLSFDELILDMMLKDQLLQRSLHAT